MQNLNKFSRMNKIIDGMMENLGVHFKSKEREEEYSTFAREVLFKNTENCANVGIGFGFLCILMFIFLSHVHFYILTKIAIVFCFIMGLGFTFKAWTFQINRRPSRPCLIFFEIANLMASIITIISLIGIAEYYRDTFTEATLLSHTLVLLLLNCVYLKRSFKFTLTLFMFFHFYYIVSKFSSSTPIMDMMRTSFQLFIQTCFSILVCVTYGKQDRKMFLAQFQYRKLRQTYDEILNQILDPVVVINGQDDFRPFLNWAAVMVFGQGRCEVVKKMEEFLVVDKERWEDLGDESRGEREVGQDDGQSLAAYVEELFHLSGSTFQENGKENGNQSAILQFKVCSKEPSPRLFYVKLWNRFLLQNQYEEGSSNINIHPTLNPNTTNTVILLMKELTLEENYKASEHSNAYLNFLIQSISHELRDPLNELGILIKRATTTQNEEDLKKSLKIAKTSTFALENKVNDILDFTAITSSTFRLGMNPFSLEKVVRKVGGWCKHRINQKNLKLMFYIDPSLSVIKADCTRITQVLLNLCANALSNTFKGVLSLKIERTKENKVRIAVSDSGCGLTKAQSQNIHPKPSSPIVSSIFKNKMAGIPGIGILTTQLICNKMEAPLNIISEPGKGTIYWFELKLDNEGFVHHSNSWIDHEQVYTDVIIPTIPAEKSENDKLLWQRQRTYHLEVGRNFFKFEGENVIALVADDNALHRDLLKYCLSNFGLKVVEADNGEAVVNEFKRFFLQKKKMLIYMDLQMPILNGMQATKIIRQISREQMNPYIIGCSAYTSPIDIDSGLDAGWNNFMSKPISFEKVKTGLASFMEGSGEIYF